jgi:hypothetical protein
MSRTQPPHDPLAHPCESIAGVRARDGHGWGGNQIDNLLVSVRTPGASGETGGTDDMEPGRSTGLRATPLPE